MRLLPILMVLATCGGCVVPYRLDLVEPPPISNPTGARWRQFCTHNGASDLGKTNSWLDDLGAKGWQLAAVYGQWGETLYCFTSRDQ